MDGLNSIIKIIGLKFNKRNSGDQNCTLVIVKGLKVQLNLYISAVKVLLGL